MDVATTLSPQGFERPAEIIGWARAVEIASTARAVDHVRWVPRLAFALIATLSVWGGAGLFGSLAGLH